MMLRNAVLAFFLLLLVLAAGGAAFGQAPWMPTLCLAVVVALIAFERGRYADRVADGPREHLSPTPERFVDPESGRHVQVWTNARGERHYVEEPPAGDGV